MLKKLIIIGGGGLRTDHLLANISVIVGEQTKDFIVDIYFDKETLMVCRHEQPREIAGNIGGTISLLPINGNVNGVNTTGLKWDLNNATLSSSRALGISNVFINENVAISIKSGSLLIIKTALAARRPDLLATSNNLFRFQKFSCKLLHQRVQ